jgi:hypothetical protein
MIACAQAQRFIPLLHDDELDSPLRHDIQDHVVTCTECTRVLAFLERSQELLRLTIDEQIEDVEFSDFWAGVESKLSNEQPTWQWRVRRQLWWDTWRSLWSWRAPIWGVVTTILLIGVAVLLWQRQSIPSSLLVSREPTIMTNNDEAQIESLAASNTVSVWNEPTHNSTVIWVSDDGEGE